MVYKLFTLKWWLSTALYLTNGNTTNYVYGADGTKRRVTHQTAIANVPVPIGSTLPLVDNQVAQTITIQR